MQPNLHSRFIQYKCCVLIPTYDNASTLVHVISSVLEYTTNIIVVNDGSVDNTREVLAKFPQIEVIHHNKNKGKGMALRTGFKHAFSKGYLYAISIDSDGQHYAEDLYKFIDLLEVHPNAIIMGARDMNQPDVPEKSTLGNRFSSFWFRVITAINLSDTQSGYRLYPLIPISKIRFFTVKYEFEIEVMVRSVWNGVEIISVPVKVYYPPVKERITHFRPFKDVTRITLLNILFVLISVFWYHPYRFFKNFSFSDLKKKIYEHTLGSSESNQIKALSMGFGVFMGIIPLWGYQMWAGIALAHFFKLNKALVVIFSNVSIPPMIPVILFYSNYIGAVMLGNSTDLMFSTNISFADISNYLFQYILGSIVLSITSGILVFIISYLLLSLTQRSKS